MSSEKQLQRKMPDSYVMFDVLGQQMLDTQVVTELGRSLAKIRVAQNITQVELAVRAGIDTRTVGRLESGKTSRLITFVRICAALGQTEWIDNFLADPVPSPMAILKQKRKMRKRASGKTVAKEESGKWVWGDDS